MSPGGNPQDSERVSKFAGVRWSNKKGKWRVRIKANRKDNHIGFVRPS